MEETYNKSQYKSLNTKWCNRYIRTLMDQENLKIFILKEEKKFVTKEECSKFTRNYIENTCIVNK